MPERLIMRRIVLPQAIRIVIPAIGNDFIAMIKDSVAGVRHRHPGAAVRGPTVGRTPDHQHHGGVARSRRLVYWVLTLFFSYVQQRLERRMARSDR